VTYSDSEGEDLAAGPWHIRTLNGYKADEVISAIQKCIRRSDVEGAVFWLTEANVSGYGAWCWRRLFTIVSEDVGLAEPLAPTVLWSLYEMTLVIIANSKKPAAGEKRVYPPLHLLHAGMYLARLPKNRELADADCTMVLRMKRRQLMEVPDVARDTHTAAGRQMGRGIGHFLDLSPEGGRYVFPEVEIDGNPSKTKFYSEWQAPENPASRVLE
jgi:replication-associated recombination protein RarA